MSDSEHWRLTLNEQRPAYILAIRAQALDRVQELIQPGDGAWVDPPLPTQEQWNEIVEAAFPPPPMAEGEQPCEWITDRPALHQMIAELEAQALELIARDTRQQARRRAQREAELS